jgi:nucleotide-binding universal stress UspA family protein
MKPQFHLPLMTYPNPSSFSIVQNAVELARYMDATLAASMQQDIMVSSNHLRSPLADLNDADEEVSRFSTASADTLKEVLRDYSEKGGVRSEILAVPDREPFAAQTLAEFSRAFDLSIMEASEHMIPLIESILFASGRPIVVFPTDNFCGRIDTVAIAWDGSATLSRALTGARLFLETASRAILISAVDDKQIDMRARDRFATVLGHAGFSVDIRAVTAADGASAGHAIQASALEGHADLLIAGAFGHSKFRELVLGGVTRSLLTRLEIPALLCH